MSKTYIFSSYKAFLFHNLFCMKSRFRILLSCVRHFLTDNKRSVICCIIALILGIALGIAFTILECGGEFTQIKLNNINFSSFKVFFKFSFFELFAYLIFIFAAFHFLLTLLSLSTILVLGFSIGKYSTILVSCYAIKGITNLVCIYLPALFLTFIVMSATLIIVIELGESGGRFGAKNYYTNMRRSCYNSNSSCNYTSSGCKVGTLYRFGRHRITAIKFKPSIKFVFIGFSINVGVNFFIFIFLGLLIPVIAV